MRALTFSTSYYVNFYEEYLLEYFLRIIFFLIFIFNNKKSSKRLQCIRYWRSLFRCVISPFYFLNPQKISKDLFAKRDNTTSLGKIRTLFDFSRKDEDDDDDNDDYYLEIQSQRNKYGTEVERILWLSDIKGLSKGQRIEKTKLYCHANAISSIFLITILLYFSFAFFFSFSLSSLFFFLLKAITKNSIINPIIDKNSLWCITCYFFFFFFF